MEVTYQGVSFDAPTPLVRAWRNLVTERRDAPLAQRMPAAIVSARAAGQHGDANELAVSLRAVETRLAGVADYLSDTEERAEVMRLLREAGHYLRRHADRIRDGDPTLTAFGLWADEIADWVEAHDLRAALAPPTVPTPSRSSRPGRHRRPAAAQTRRLARASS